LWGKYTKIGKGNEEKAKRKEASQAPEREFPEEAAGK
jgi:hypothetical protein